MNSLQNVVAVGIARFSDTVSLLIRKLYIVRCLCPVSNSALKMLNDDDDEVATYQL